MKRIVRLTESELTNLVKRIIKEQKKTYESDDGVKYSYEVIGEYEKNNTKYDLVRYYFTITDNTNLETETDDVRTKKVDKIIYKLDFLDLIPYKKIEGLGYVKISPTEKIPSDLTKNNIKKSYDYFVRKEDNKRFKLENLQFDTTYLTPKGYHFNVGYLDY
jgi:hypothetical protein